jgi:hypothetical protein
MQSPALALAAAALLAACPPSLVPQWIQDVNTLVGLVGFAITIVIWWQVRNVKQSFRSRARLPDITGDLKTKVVDLSALLDRPQPPWIVLRAALSSISATLEIALPFAPPRARTPVRDAIRCATKAVAELDLEKAGASRSSARARDAMNRALLHLTEISVSFHLE